MAIIETTGFTFISLFIFTQIIHYLELNPVDFCVVYAIIIIFIFLYLFFPNKLLRVNL